MTGATAMTTLFVASTGGHLAQLFDLAGRINGLGEDRLWITFDSEQSRTLLAGKRKVFIPYIAERDWVGVLRGARIAHRIMQSENVRAVVSTGSAVALSFLPYASLGGIEAHYIESAARVGRASLTGRILDKVPGVSLYRQYPHVAGGRWRYGGSIFDGFQGTQGESRPIRRVVVTLGIERSFRRLIERAIELLPSGTEVLWQTGLTPIEGLGIDVRPFVPAAMLDQAMLEADLVIAHAGCGSALAALKAGKYPVLVPRDPCHGEVIDTHQIEIARWLAQRDLAVERTPENLTFSDLQAAAARSVRRLSDAPPFRLWLAA